MNLIDLLDNMLVWYGSTITRQIYREYLFTYISIERPPYLPAFVHDFFNARALKVEFDQALRTRGIVVLEEQVKE